MIFGKILYHLYFRPKAEIKRMMSYGLIGYFGHRFDRYKMIKESSKLHEIFRGNLTSFNVYFLTGKKYWFQTAFCLHSLQKNCTDFQVNGIFIDDGTINKKLQSKIKRQFPNSRIIINSEIEAILDKKLPANRFPTLRRRRLSYPHLKKITDIHLLTQGWKLVLDSDMLFFKSPTIILDWLTKPQLPFFMRDKESSYYYSTALMEQLVNNKIINQLNVGAVGLNSDTINWDDLESWITVLEREEGTHYYLEQALSAMLAAGDNIIVADEQEYKVMPEKYEIEHPNSTLFHFVASSRDDYFKKAWRTFV
jgi:hypothetical protein